MEVWRGVGEGLQAVIINPSIILGLGDWSHGSAQIFKSVYDEFPWYTNGVTGFVDVLDVVEAMTPINEQQRFRRTVYHQCRKYFLQGAICKNS